MAEIEISVFERLCLNRRLTDGTILVEEAAALEAERNRAQANIEWQFTCGLALTKLHRLYSNLE